MQIKLQIGSHMDHHLSVSHLALIVAAVAPMKDEFTIITVDIPASLPAVPCNLRGPDVGTAPVMDEHVRMKTRTGRDWDSRILDLVCSPLMVRKLTAVIGPDGTLYTVYGGPVAPREPGDPSMSDEERVLSVEFWSKHALLV